MQAQRTCPHCGATFTADSNYRERKYCSKECGYAAKTARSHTERICGNCGVRFMAKNHEIRRGSGKYCSRACRDASHPGPPRDLAVRMRVERRGAGNPAYVGDNAGFATAHDRIRAERGKASDCDCVSCGRPARDWALRHDAEQTKVARNGRVYSLNVDDYMPMCRRCHWHYDHPDGAPERYFGANAWRAA